MRRRIEESGVDINQSKYDVKRGTFFFRDESTGRLQPLVFLKNRRGEEVPVYRVRVRETLNNSRLLKTSDSINQYVNPRNNHHIAIFQNADGEYREEMVSLWDAVERKKLGKPVISEPDANETLRAVLQENAMLLIEYPQGTRLLRVQKISQGDYVLRDHNAATIANDAEMIRIQSFQAYDSLKPNPVRVGILGVIEYA